MNDNNGQFTKGHEKKGGRKKGTTNKATTHIKERVQSFIDDNFDTVLNDLEELEPLERVKFYLKLLEFVLPKQKSLEVEQAEHKGIAPIMWLQSTGIPPITNENDLIDHL